MTDNLRDRIAAVVGRHEPWQIPDGTWECSCGQDFELRVNLDAHVADAVIQELGLKPELRRAVVCFPAKYFQGLEKSND